MRRLPPYLLFSALLFPAMRLGAQPYTPDGRTLLLDHFDETFVPDGKLCTKPAVIKPEGDFVGGRPGKGGRFTPGKFGGALEFHGLMDMWYPAGGNLNLSAGVVEFWVALGFNAEEQIKNPGVLSNQLFFTVWGPGTSQVCLYSTLSQTCVCIYDRARQIVCYGGFPGYWKKGEWHHLELRWGRQLELWCDGKREVTQDWQGLFGPIDVKPDEVRLSCGSHLGWSTVESEFALDELRILGPGGDQVPDHPTLTVCRTKAPVIDGKLDENEWAGAARTTGFVGLNDYALAEDQTAVYAGWDEESLYLAYECSFPENRDVVARLRERDSGVYMEDSVDAILQPSGEPHLYYQLISNAIGTVYDSRITPGPSLVHDPRFDPSWTVKTSVERGRFIVECKIPFRELDGRPAPKDGERWRVNFCRDSETISRYSSWAYAAGNFHRPENFGEVIFSAGDRAVRLNSLGDWAMGKPEAQLSLTGLAFDPLVIVKGKVTGADAKVIVAQENRLADYRAVNVKCPTLVTGLYNLTLNAAAAAQPMYYQRLPFRVLKPYDISAEGYPYEGKLWVTANAAGLADAPKGLVARTRLVQGDRVLGTCETTDFPRGLGAAAIDIAELPPGKYAVKSEAVAPDGRVLASADADFEQFPRPAWWRNRIGLDHSIPWPWQPVKVSEQGIVVWGREYRCGQAALPRQIVNQKQEILAAPISLALTAEGKTVDLAALRAVDAAGPSDMLVRHSSTMLGRLKVELMTTTEFDGMQRCDLTLTPSAPLEVSSLLLEVPLKSRFATFALPSNGSAATAVRLGKEPWRSAFMPMVWLGDDDLGFAWFAETDQYWRPHDNEMLEVSPEGAKTVLRCRMVRQPLRLEKPLTLTFGFMATPVKDAHPGDPFWFRMGRADERVPGESCRYPGNGNFDPKQGTLEFQLAPLKDLRGTWREVVGLRGQGGDATVYYYPGQRQIQLQLTTGEKKEYLVGAAPELRVGEFTHVAVTWGDRIELFCGGKRCGTLNARLPAEMATGPDKLRLIFGCHIDYQGSASLALDEVRVSSSIRYQGEAIPPPAAPFKPDSETLLLDHLDERFRPDGEDAETRATVIAGKSGELGGVPSIGCTFGEGRFGGALQLPDLNPMTPKEIVQRYGFNTELIWWMIEENAETTGWPPPLMTEPLIKNLRQTVKTDTALGLRPSPYMGYPALGGPSPLASQFGAEWSRRPLSTQPAEPPKGHYMWDMCGHSGFADYMAAGTQWVLDDLGFYGCYTDGLAQVYACQNTHHGCGYYDSEGNLHSTFPLFATREMLKRMYKLIHARHEDGYLVNHVSFGTTLPGMSFTDIYYSGEHEQYEDLLKFRVRWQGKQWGFWPFLLGGDAHIYEPMHTTYCLLHGVAVWPQGLCGRNDAMRKTANLNQTYDRFGYREAEWTPYYRAEQGPAKADSESVKVSLYLHRGKRALLIVGNLAAKVVETKVSVDLKRLGLASPKAKNALTDQPLPLQAGSMPVRIRPNSMVLVWVE